MVMHLSHAFQRKKSCTKSPFALALLLANLFAFSETSVMDGVVILFKENDALG